MTDQPDIPRPSEKDWQITVDMLDGVQTEGQRQVQEVLDDAPKAKALLDLLTCPVDLPLTPHTRAAWQLQDSDPTVVNMSPALEEGELHKQAGNFWYLVDHTLAQLGIKGSKRERALEFGTQGTADFLQVVSPIIETGRMRSLTEKLTMATERGFLPAVLLVLATTALVEEEFSRFSPAERELCYEERLKLAVARSQVSLGRMCANITSGNKASQRPKNSAPATQRVAWGSLEALRRCYIIGDSAEDKQRIAEPLVTLLLTSRLATEAAARGSDITKVPVIVAKSEADARRAPLLRNPVRPTQSYNIDKAPRLNMVEIMPAVAARINRALMALGLPDCTAILTDRAIEYRAAQVAVAFHRDKIVRDNLRTYVNQGHTELIIRQTARSLVDGLALGEIDLGPTFEAGALVNRRPLGERAQVVKARIAAEREAREEEDRRLAEERLQQQLEHRARVEEQLKALGLTWEVLPTGTSDVPRQRTGDSTTETKPSNGREIDAYRLQTLVEIQQAWGGTIYQSNFTKAAGTGERVAREPYHVLVFEADGVTYALAECAQVDNALYIYRSDFPGIQDWRLVFSQDRGHAFAQGAYPLQHPRKSVRDRDPVGTADRFGMRVLETAFMPIDEFVHAWSRMRTRLLGRRAVDIVSERS